MGPSIAALLVCCAAASGNDVSPVITVVRALVRVARPTEYLKVAAHIEQVRVNLPRSNVIDVQQWFPSAERKLPTASGATMFRRSNNLGENFNAYT